MTLESMTGYSVSEGGVILDTLGKTWQWSWELRSVNSKGFDLRLRLPPGRESLEPSLKKNIISSVKRGTITAILEKKSTSSEKKLMVNQSFLQQIQQIHERLKLEGIIDGSTLTLDKLLMVPGVIEVEKTEKLSSADNELINAAIIDDFKNTVERLTEMRCAEGRKLSIILEEQRKELSDLCTEARILANASKHKYRDQLKNQISSILEADLTISEDRLAQEVAIIITKLDISEEIDRLSLHLETCKELLNSSIPVGRQLDFICQELNREANTLCSKSNHSRLTAIGIDLKIGIEKFREQIQNIQ
jgi:uncharacterized protein (TIGR00255 family)